jgi:hypothetical protein
LLQVSKDCRAVFLLLYKAGEEMRLLELDNNVIEAMQLTPEVRSRNKGKHREMDMDKFKERYANWLQQQLKQMGSVSGTGQTQTSPSPELQMGRRKRGRDEEPAVDDMIEPAVTRWLKANLGSALDKSLAPLLVAYSETARGKPRKRGKKHAGFPNLPSFSVFHSVFR